MEINVDAENKRVHIWLRNEEKADEDLQKRVRSICGAYRAQKYAVAVFLSGRSNLLELSGELLLHNR
jgi:hypothetical protein